jgi:hypothetical protein
VSEQPELNHRGSLTAGSLPLPDPYPEYIACPHCGEPEVEVWCYQAEVQCHQCGQWIKHEQPPCVGSSPICKGMKRPDSHVGNSEEL